MPPAQGKQPEGPVAIVGLGNPGRKYDFTRHNIGFLVIDVLAQRLKVSLSSITRMKGQVCDTEVSGRRTYFLKPSTFMNLSGESVSELVRFYKIPLENVLVVHDDLDQSPGAIKFALNGGEGGHNGIRSCYQYMSKEFWRLKIGIGKPTAGKGEVSNYVLSAFTRDETPLVQEAVETSADAVEAFITNGVEQAMNRFNRKKSPLEKV